MCKFSVVFMRYIVMFVISGILSLTVGYPVNARFVSPDDWDTTQQGVGTNRYAYASNDPINLSDPNGHIAHIAIAGGIAGLASGALEVGMQLYTNGGIQSWSDVGAATVEGAVYGALGAATMGTATVGAAVGTVARTGIQAAERAGATTASNAAASVGSTSTKAGAQLATNRAAGKAFENQVGKELSTKGVTIGKEVSIVTQSGTRVRMDFLTKNPSNGVIGCVECKASITAPLTKNQKLAFPEIEKTGATIVGRGAPGFSPGTHIKPTAVEIIRGK